MAEMEDILQSAIKIISPSWPLQSFVGVNPFWNLKEENFYLTLAHLSHFTNNGYLYMPIGYYIEKYNNGDITNKDILKTFEIIKHLGFTFNDLNQFIRESFEIKEESIYYKTYSEYFCDKIRKPAKDIIVDEISKYCASYFDLGQSAFSLNNSAKNLYSQWLEFIIYDNNLQNSELKLKEINIHNIAKEPIEMIKNCCHIMQLHQSENIDNYIKKICMLTAGWCSYIKYQNWQQNLSLKHNSKETGVEDIVAIYLAYEVLLKQSYPELDSNWSNFIKNQEEMFKSRKSKIDHIFKLLIIWQRAFEYSYQKKLSNDLVQANKPMSKNVITADTQSKVQMIFCIDVRSEIIRRKIENSLPHVETYGFAGFFGASIDCRHLSENSHSYRCPVLLKPKIQLQESYQEQYEKKISGLKSLEKFTNGLKQGLASSLLYIEFFGSLSMFKILSQSMLGKRNFNKLFKHKFFRPSLYDDELSLENKVEIANSTLIHLGIKTFAKIVIICGHGSITTNNAFASSLECGACGGHSGDLNSRFICSILNNPDVRKKLSKGGNFVIPNETVFIPAIHETVSDEIRILDYSFLQDEHKKTINQMEGSFKNCALLAQEERSEIFKNILDRSSERSTNWAEVRPEWALVNNASFIIAPRIRTKYLNLKGRSFLHDYNYFNDEDFKSLELILTAPMVVTNWINMQYFASTVGLGNYSSGNKVLQNVVGTFGVLEGNGGDLKIGLPFQSIHDGSKFVHEPLRLSVYIEAPFHEIEKIIMRNKVIYELITNEWIHIFCIDSLENRILYRNFDGKYSELGARFE